MSIGNIIRSTPKQTTILLIDVLVALFEIVQVLSTPASCNKLSNITRSYGQAHAKLANDEHNRSSSSFDRRPSIFANLVQKWQYFFVDYQ